MLHTKVPNKFSTRIREKWLRKGARSNLGFRLAPSVYLFFLLRRIDPMTSASGMVIIATTASVNDSCLSFISPCIVVKVVGLCQLKDTAFLSLP